MKTSVCPDTFVIIDDSQRLLVISQMVNKRSCRKRLFQIVLAPAHIDLIEIRGFAFDSWLDLKVSCRFQERQNVIALLHSSFQVIRRPLADGKLIVVLYQPVQSLQSPQENAVTLSSQFVDQKRIILSVCRLFSGGQKQLPAVKAVGFIVKCVQAAVAKAGEPGISYKPKAIGVFSFGCSYEIRTFHW